MLHTVTSHEARYQVLVPVRPQQKAYQSFEATLLNCFTNRQPIRKRAARRNSRPRRGRVALYRILIGGV